MSFEEMARRYHQLQAQWRSGQLSYEQFIEAVNGLRFQDAGGRWWQMDTSGNWLFWNGSAWVAQAPVSSPGAGQIPAAGYAGQDSAKTGSADYRSAREAWGELKGYVLSPQSFLRESRGVPLLKRSRLWWDALSVFGGAVSGLLWFIYSSVRGFSREGLDLVTPLIMVILPVGLALLRSQIDKALLPLQKLRRRLPRLVLVGAGLVAPFVVAQLLYGHFREYRYLHVTIVVGTVISYLILRTPQVHPQPDILKQSKGGVGT